MRFLLDASIKESFPLLIHKLKELQNDDLLKNTNYPRLITSQILSDWLFQYPTLLKDVVKIIVNGINIGSIINQDNDYTASEPIMLLSNVVERKY